MVAGAARLAMNTQAANTHQGCTACHAAHDFNTRRAAVDACLSCHNDTHSQAYRKSPHYALWQKEIAGSTSGTGVSCATCHMPRTTKREQGVDVVRVEHNQNANLRPNEKMLREVCMQCHGLSFALDALADPTLIQRNFAGRPGVHIESLDMTRQRSLEKPPQKNRATQ